LMFVQVPLWANADAPSRMDPATVARIVLSDFIDVTCWVGGWWLVGTSGFKPTG